MDKKKESELNIFQLAIDKKSYKDFQHRDKPDFWVESVFRSTLYGVEVTELFISETDARLHKISDYTGELLDSKKYRHRDDIHRLNVSGIILESPNGDRMSVPAIKLESITFAEHEKFIVQRITEKDSQFNDYAKELQFHLLLIRDRTRIFRYKKLGEFYNAFFNDDLIGQIIKSNFRELFLVLEIDKKLFKVPLKGMILLSKLYFFDEILKEKKVEDDEEIELYEFLKSFAEFLIHEGYSELYIERSENEIVLICGCWGITIINNRITVRDHTTFEPDFSSMEKIERKDLDEETQQIIETTRKRFGFSTSFALELNGENE